MNKIQLVNEDMMAANEFHANKFCWFDFVSDGIFSEVAAG